MIVPLVPILAVAVALAPVSPGLLAALGTAGVVLGTAGVVLGTAGVVLGTAGVVLGIAGVVLSRRSVDRWSARDRRG
jgi:hypothetical protein